ncbi:MAG: amidase [Candidatus Dormibacteria bacterium]
MSEAVTTDPFEWMDAVAQAELVHRGEVSPLELVDAAIARLEARNPALNAVVTTTFDRARALACSVDRSLPLAGVPFLIKDQLDWIGVRTTHGSRFMLDNVATTNSPILDRWLAAGVVPIGKTNVPECGLLGTTEPLVHGASCNPWDLTRTTGGSSGGSAAAVVAGMVAVASASDGGGSIRIPASACGLVGLKPTRGRTAGAGWGGLAVNHVVTRSVRDSAAFLDVGCGPEPGTLYPLSRPAQPFLDAIASEPRKLRIAVAPDIGWEGVRYAPEVLSALRRTADLLAGLGHEVVTGRPHLPEAFVASVIPKLDRIVPAAVARSVDVWAAVTGRTPGPGDLEPLTWQFVERGREVGAGLYFEAMEARQQLAAAAEPFFAEHDIWLLPTLGEVPPPNGDWQLPADEPMYAFLRMSMFIPPLSTALANYTGQPAISLPLETDEATGLPIGLQFYGGFGDEVTLLQLARQLEQARPWAERHPRPSAGS